MLPSLLNFVVTTLQRSSLCGQVQVVSSHAFSERQFAIKVRAVLNGNSVLQVRLYRNGDHTDYAYQLIRDDEPIRRWDNKEHFPMLTTYPHHFHTTDGRVEESSLNGRPAHDLPFVLMQLLDFVP